MISVFFYLAWLIVLMIGVVRLGQIVRLMKSILHEVTKLNVRISHDLIQKRKI